MENVGVRSMIENRLSSRARHFPTKKSASRDGTSLVRRGFACTPSFFSVLPFPSPLRGPLPPFRPPSPSPRPSPPLDPLLSLSCFSRGSPSSCTLPPSSLSPPRRPTGCTLTCNERDRPAGTQLPLAPCISESVSQSVSQSLSQLVGESGRRYTRDGGIVSALNYLHSLFARNVLPLPFSLSPFLVVFFVLLSCEIYSRRGSFGRVACCWPRASLFAARV